MSSVKKEKATIFYVDPTNGDDSGAGTIDRPFGTIDHALSMVGGRAAMGIRSDKIYLRGGVYRKESYETLYHLELKGTESDYAAISAMPAEAHAPGAVQRKSGRWYEKVVFDDANIIKTTWEKDCKRKGIWKTKPGFVRSEWSLRRCLKGTDLSPENSNFTIAPFMLLQDGEPTLWAEKPDKIMEPGMRYYDQESDTLYLRPHHDKNPNNCLVETWYGGPEQDGKKLMDGEGRAIFDGNMEYTAIQGIEFRMFTRLFELRIREWEDPSKREVQRYVRFEDNECQYGWIQILLDSNIIITEKKETFTRFEDRSHWLVRNNKFYRPSREVCQLHGRDHVFEYNDIIEHGGPWAGPAAIVSSVNTRNTINMKIRYNYIEGQGDNPWNSGSVFMIEADRHADENGDYIFGGQTYEGNIIVNITSGIAMILGKGAARMRDITVRGNMFIGNKRDSAIRISTPHQNLIIENNLFCYQMEAIEVADLSFSDVKIMKFETMRSSIRICNNVFINNRKCIHPRLLSKSLEDQVIIENNHFLKGDQRNE